MQSAHNDTQRLFNTAALLAYAAKQPMTADWIFQALLRSEDTIVPRFLDQCGVDAAKLIDKSEPIADLATLKGIIVRVDPIVQTLMEHAFKECDGDTVRPRHICMGILKTDCPITKRLADEHGIKWSNEVKETLNWLQPQADGARLDLPPAPPKTIGFHAEGEKNSDVQASSSAGSDKPKDANPQEPGKSFLPASLPAKIERPRLLHGSPLMKLGAVDVTAQAAEGKLEPYLGDPTKIDFLIAILGRKDKGNPCITGGAGGGKTTLVRGLAKRIVDGDVPDFLHGAIIAELTMNDAVAGTKYRGEFEENLKAVLKQIEDNAKEGKPPIILFIDELHTIVGAGATRGGTLDGSNILKPALTRPVNPLRCIGATTAAEYRAYIQKDKALRRRFEEVRLEDPNAEDATLILAGLAFDNASEKNPLSLEGHHHVTITIGAIRHAVELAMHYAKPKGFAVVDSAKTYLDTACSTARCQQNAGGAERVAARRELASIGLQIRVAEREPESNNLAQLQARKEELEATIARSVAQAVVAEAKPIVITEEDIDRAYILSSGPLMPDGKRLSQLLERIQGMVGWPSGPIESVVNAIKVAKAGLNDKRQPLGSFLFLGPTGVGKTEVARALAFALFDDPDAVIRLDMSEYMEKHTVSRLIGAPPGYVGYEQEGTLTEPVNRRPYCVLLLDEIEKAHDDVFNILLQVMDHGRLTDGQGNAIDFRNVLLIMTSNEGAEELKPEALFDITRPAKEAAKPSNDQMQQRVIKAANRRFKPELLNRLTEVCVFMHLTEKEIGEVTPMKVNALIRQIAEVNHFKLDVQPEVIKFLCDRGFSRAFGARQLLRAIYKYIKVPLADPINNGDFQAGDTVVVSLDTTTSGKEKVLFHKAPRSA